jgi:hypothetical protein
LIFALSFSQWIVIQWRLLVQEVPALNAVLGDLWVFALLFIVVYIPAALLIGYWHRIKQMRTETMVYFEQSPYWAMITKFNIRLFLTATHNHELLKELDLKPLTTEEIKSFYSWMDNIEKGINHEKK